MSLLPKGSVIFKAKTNIALFFKEIDYVQQYYLKQLFGYNQKRSSVLFVL